MGTLVEKLKKQFIINGWEKKQATIKSHEYCEKYNICRACSESIKMDEKSWKQGYCIGCC
jgi:hypothetical protein